MTPTNEMRELATDVVRKLRESGFESLWAGGCVRDFILGIAPKDFDVATNARPEEVKKIFRRTVAVGESFGVIRVMGRGTLAVEVATFRTDSQYSDGRHPDAVTFATAKEDAQRRDFTINGMFFDPLGEQVIDYVGGKDDLQKRIIRAIGKPLDRIAEDKLRMIRAVRFAARFQFQIEEQTLAAIQSRAAEIHIVSAERVLTELRSILCAPSRCCGLELLRQSQLLPEILRQIANEIIEPEKWSKTLKVLDQWKDEVTLGLALAGLTASLEIDEAVTASDAILKTLKAPNIDRIQAGWLISHRNALTNPQQRTAAYLKRVFANSNFGELLRLHRAMELVETGESRSADYCQNYFASMSANQINPLPLVTGDDLLTLGVPAGPVFKTILDQVRDAQLNGDFSDKAAGLIIAQEIAKSAAGNQ